MKAQLTHICLHVDNADECVSFYRRYCDLIVIDDRRIGGEGSVYLSASHDPAALIFQIMSGGSSRVQADSDARHFGYSVETRDRIDAIAALARHDGILFWEPDEYLPGAYLCAVKDPNGNCIEFGWGHPVPPLGAPDLSDPGES